MLAEISFDFDALAFERALVSSHLLHDCLVKIILNGNRKVVDRSTLKRAKNNLDLLESTVCNWVRPTSALAQQTNWELFLLEALSV